ncbi:hypothetical protein F511_12285 [Dorcoceras hygrometricum]|uniref:Uncharacterized protein n=1 Tax=Dorcoceras hygrometricum TaxID=472368 RepID=A0A2Z7BQQ0_9LAMI|nr:hypothetical protein F511_12285 [Dorcoceras hygrometricum]
MILEINTRAQSGIAFADRSLQFIMSGRGKGRRNQMSGDNNTDDNSRFLNGMAQFLEYFLEESSSGSGKSSKRTPRPEDPQERFRRQRPQDSQLDKPRCAVCWKRWRIRIPSPGDAAEVLKLAPGNVQYRIQLAVGPQPLRLRNHNFGLAQRIMVKRLATSHHDPLGITDTACKNQLVVVSVQYGPFNPYIPIRSTTIGKSRVARDPIAMHTSWRSNSDIASVTSIGYPRMRASGESSTTIHRLLHASGSHPIPPSNDPKTNQYNQDLGLIHSTNGNHLESPNEVSSIDH